MTPLEVLTKEAEAVAANPLLPTAAKGAIRALVACAADQQRQLDDLRQALATHRHDSITPQQLGSAA